MNSKNRAACLFVLLFAFAILCGCKKHGLPPVPAEAQPDVCVRNLQVIASGKQMWAQANNKSAEDTPTMEDLIAYTRHPLVCPGGGTYTMGKVSELPSCSVAAHNDAFKKSMANPNP